MKAYQQIASEINTTITVRVQKARTLYACTNRSKHIIITFSSLMFDVFLETAARSLQGPVPHACWSLNWLFLFVPGQDDNHRLLFVHLGGERYCERKLPFPRRYGNAPVTRSARSGVQTTNHLAATVLCARQLPVLYEIRTRYYVTCS